MVEPPPSLLPVPIPWRLLIVLLLLELLLHR
jgi:hypothetical protein